MDVRILVVPYDSGHRAVRMGRGPLHLIEYGLEDALEAAGHDARVVMIDSGLEPPTETAVAFDLARTIAREVRAAREAGAFPLVLAGNCFSAVGTVPGLGPEPTGVLWFDAHGDLNTPETTRSGFVDGMAVAALTGRCWTTMTASVPGFSPLPDQRLVFVAVRDLDAAEEEVLRSSDLTIISTEAVKAPGSELDTALRRLGDSAGVYVHVDLDVLDPAVARANRFAAENGLGVGDVLAVVERACEIAPPVAVALTAFDPAFDEQGRDSAAATAIIVGVLGHAAAARRAIR